MCCLCRFRAENIDTENGCHTKAGSRLWGFWWLPWKLLCVCVCVCLSCSPGTKHHAISKQRVQFFWHWASEFVCVSVCVGSFCLCPSHQDGVLYVVAQQPRIVEGVLGFLHSGIHWPFLDLVLDGSEQFVQGLACRVLVRTHTHTLRSHLRCCQEANCCAHYQYPALIKEMEKSMHWPIV